MPRRDSYGVRDMHTIGDDDARCAEILAAIEADDFAEKMDDILLDIAELDPGTCPPDRRYFLGEREAWVYEHGNICELVFVKT